MNMDIISTIVVRLLGSLFIICIFVLFYEGMDRTFKFLRGVFSGKN